MGIDNVLDAHGIGIAITGMAVVFTGLVLVSLFLTLLPRVLGWIEPETRLRRAVQRRGPAAGESPAAPATTSGMEPEMLAAITYVLQAERDRELALDDQRITVRDDDEQRVWTAIGKMRTLATRLT